MDTKTFFDNFGHLADAPNGVQKLRELILQLAVRGKLVPQDPADEPASKLLERIKAEKGHLVKEKKIRKSDPLPAVTAEEAPYELPQGWEWVKLGNITIQITDGTHHTPSYVASGVPFLSIKDISAGAIDFSSTKFITQKEHEELSNRCRPERGDILICRIGTLGKAVHVDTERPFSIFVSLGLVKVSRMIFGPYLVHLLNSPVLHDQYQAIKAGGSHASKLNLGDIPKLLIPVPPIQEQVRIAERVDNLLAMCNTLETRQGKSQRMLLGLNNAALERLTTASNADDFSAVWQLVRDSFDLLYTTHDNIAKLRQTILQLAVQGKLLSHKNVDQWRGGVLGDVVKRSEAGWSPQCENRPRTGEEWGVLKVSAVSWGRFRAEENKALPKHLLPRKEYEVKTGDFLISRANTEELVAKSVVVAERPERLLLSDKTVRLHFCSDASPDFFCMVNNSPSSREYYAAVAGGTSSSMKNVTRQQILSLPVLIPPLTEQHLIVAKVEKLMTHCDKLETLLRQADTKAERMAVVVCGVVAA